MEQVKTTVAQAAFPFRGKREYILVADLLDTTLRRLYGELIYPAVMDLTILQKSRFEGLELVLADEATELQKAQALALYTDAEHRLFLLPHGKESQERVPDNDADIALAFSVHEQKQEIDIPDLRGTQPECSLARACVIAYKILLQQCQIGSGVFLFARLKFEGLQPGPLTLRYQRLVGGLFWEGALLQKGCIVGHIYFTKKES